MSDNSDLEWVEDEFSTFCRNQQVKKAILNSVSLLEMNDFDSILQLISKAVNAGEDKTVGLDYNLDIEARYREDDRSCIPFPWSTFNELTQGGYGKGDCGAIVDGWHGDAAFSIGMGAIDPEDQKLMDVCEESMWRGIAAGKNGARLSDIGYAIEQYTNSQGKHGILQEYGGHGVGTEMHQEPHVLNFGKAGNGPEIIPGFVLAIEPMITRGSARTKVLADEWTVVSADKSRGSHFEHTYAMLSDGKPFVFPQIS